MPFSIGGALRFELVPHAEAASLQRWLLTAAAAAGVVGAATASAGTRVSGTDVSLGLSVVIGLVTRLCVGAALLRWSNTL